MLTLRRLFTCLAWLLWATLASFTTLAQAAEPPSEPILRIDPAMHTAMIRRIATDADGRWLVTASDDKTARVWDLASGRLLQVLRPPQGPGNEGKLYAVALSPDGVTVAAGGWTQFDEGRYSNTSDFALYLFDRASGRLLRRLGGLPGVIEDLAFSADGRHLAATLSSGGVRVWRSDSWQLLGQDTDYGDQSYGADFSRDGRLVTSSWDGFLRLYRVNTDGLRLLAKASAPGGKQPYAVRFSPDGHHIAVGFADSTAVNVLDGRSLAFLFAPDTAGTNNGDLVAVALSADGQRLFAGGRYSSNGSYPIRQWSQAGRGQPRDEAAAGGTVMDLRPLPGGGLAFGTGDPAWGSLDAAGRRNRFVAGPIADYRDNWDGFQLSQDGRTVRFSYAPWGKSPALFDLTQGLVADGSLTMPLAPPRTSAPGLVVTDWKYTISPKLNGQPLALKPYETSRSLAIAPDGGRFVLGTEWNLHLFGASGKQLWQVPLPGPAWAVNISGDGQTVVAALTDGTLRWYDIADGREKLAVFPHADRKRWVAWTPSGYYSASPGGEELIGWHVNNGKDGAADFFPASRFRSRFYRPDVVARSLSAPSEAEALRLADAEAGRRPEAQPVKVQNILPPVLDIVSPADGGSVATSSVTLRYRSRSPADAPVTAVRARVNGQAVTTRNLTLQAAGDLREITVPIPAEDSEIQLFAENKNGVSTPATLRLKWAGTQPAPQEQAIFKPKLYVLAVGVSKYANPDYNLGLAAKDAQDFARVLQAQKGKLYADVQVKLLTNDKATKDDVLDGLEWLKRQVTAKDVGMMFLAGHGMNDDQNNYYFLPHNADPDRLLRTGVAQNDIKLTLNSLAGKAVFFVDSCHSGNALGTAKARGIGADINAFVNELASAENGVVVFTAATGKQVSLEDPAWGNGAFTKAVVEGLSGKADFQHNGKITHKGLDYYVAERVKELTRGRQSPVSITPAGVTDFPIAVSK